MAVKPGAAYSPEAGFPEIHPAFSDAEAKIESGRCLYCYDAPCVRACPTHIDIPKFIGRIHTGDVRGAARAILDANILGGTCARVCPVEELCEGACVEVALQRRPIPISALQRYAVDHVMHGRMRLFAPGAPTGKRVAIVGAGPAGLSCAFELRRAGHAVTIFDARELPGGVNTYTIAPYKHSVDFCLEEVELVRQMGVEFRQGVLVGRDVTFEEIRSGSDAVFLGLGLGHTRKMGIPGEDLPGVWEALAYLEASRTAPPDKQPRAKAVAVVGGGNTAIDCATTAARLGAEMVMIIYRRGRADVPAFPYEQEIARLDEVLFVCNTLPVEVIAQNGRASALRCVRTQPGPPGPGGKSAFEVMPGSDRILGADQIIMALGQQPWEAVPGLESLKTMRGGLIEVDPVTHETSMPGVFCGGDAINGGGEVVDAVEHGKIAARGIHCRLFGLDAARLGLPGDNGGPRQAWHSVRRPSDIRPPAPAVAPAHH